MDLALRVPLADVRQDLGLAKLPDGLLNEAVLVGRAEVDHAGILGAHIPPPNVLFLRRAARLRDHSHFPPRICQLGTYPVLDQPGGAAGRSSAPQAVHMPCGAIGTRFPCLEPAASPGPERDEES